ncbi:MAG: hypothetical protein V4702_06470 [Patescibacteria group bacterium]
MKLSLKNKKQMPQERMRPRASSNPKVFSYYARGSSSSDNNVGRGDEKNQVRTRTGGSQHWVRLLPSYIALVIITIALVYATLLQPTPRIILLNSPGTIHRDAGVYDTAMRNIWKQSLLNRSKLTVSSRDISSKIQEEFNELAAVNIQLPLLGSRPTVVLTPARPSFQLVGSNGSFYVAESGKVMSRIEDVSQNELGEVPIIRDESGITAEPGKSILSSQETNHLVRLFNQLKSANVEVLSIVLPKNAAQQADVRLVGQQYYIKFSIDVDPRQAVGTYLAAAEKFKADNVAPQEYVDVRVEEKIFYR